MTEKIELFKCLLFKEFWNDYRYKIVKEIFPEELWDLYESLEEAHRVTNSDLNGASLWEKHKELNPTMTEAQKRILHGIVCNISAAEDLNGEIAQSAVNRALVEHKATQIAQAALLISQGKSEDWTLIEKLLKEDVVKQDIELVTTDLKELTDDIQATYKYRFNLKELDYKVGPIGPEVFCVLAGNVNTGKSLAAISFVFSPGGFLEQGAKVLYVGNEESLKRTMLRGASSYTGKTKNEIVANPVEVQKEFDKIINNCYMIDDVTMNFNKLNHIADKLKPDIIVLDMLDNIVVTGSFQRGDEKLGRIYQSARELAKKHSCCVIGLSQTSAESMGKLYVGFDKLANSKVDKAAAADLILIMGKMSDELNADTNSNFRVINVAKSKLEGNGERINCQIQPQYSRLVA